jgi:hypothetical protein
VLGERVKLQSFWWLKSKYANFDFDYQIWRRCNIPPVSIGILPVIMPEELKSWKSNLMENNS